MGSELLQEKQISLPQTGGKVMELIMKIFGWPLGFIMLGCYLVTGNNYALAITVFTIVTKVLLLPLSIKQQKEQAKMMLFQPKLENIQKKYANNRERYNEEVQKLYTEEGYNPMTGCLPALLQFPILFGVIDVVYKPIYHILRVSNSVINAMAETAIAAGHDLGTSYYTQLNLLKVVRNNRELFSSFDSEVIDKIANFNMNLFGLDLSTKPEFAFTFEGSFNWYLLIPILCGLFQFIQTIYTSKTGSASSSGGAMNIMLYTMPLFSVYIAFIVPSGVGFYWTISAICMLIQSIFLNLLCNPKKMAEKIQAELDAQKEARRQQRVEAREKLKELQKNSEKSKRNNKESENGENDSATLKEINRRKLAEARKRDAEKYGEEYVEVTDDDLK